MKLLKNKLSRNTLVMLISNIGSAVLSFVLSVLIGRVLGEGGLGVYASALAWIFPLSIITEFGIGTLITRDLAHSPDDTAGYVQSALKARFIIGGLLILIVWLIAPMLSDNPQVVHGLRLSTPMIVLVPLYTTYTAVFRARQIMQPIAYLNLGMLFAQVTLTTIVFIAGGGLYGALIVNVVTSGGQVIVAWWIYEHGFKPKAQASLPTISTWGLLRRAWPFAVAALLGAMQLRLNYIFLERFTNTETVGLYAAASRFVEAGALLPAALFGALLPALAELREQPEQPSRLRRLMRRIQIGLLLYALCFGIATFVLGDIIITLTYGANFVPSIIHLQILAWSLVPALLKSSQILYWYAHGYEWIVNLITAIALSVQIVLSMVLIPDYGAIGAIAAIISTEVVSLVLLSSIGLVLPKAKNTQ